MEHSAAPAPPAESSGGPKRPPRPDPPGWGGWLGRVVSSLLHPNLLQAGLFMALYRPLNLYTGAVLFLGLAALPMAVMALLLQRHVPDRFSFVLRRELRYIPIGVNLLFVLASFALLYSTAPPTDSPGADSRGLLPFLLTAHVGLHVAAILITHVFRFKISLHMLGVTAGSALAVLLSPGPWRLAVLAGVLLLVSGLAWSRLRLRAHNTWEVLAGILTGGLLPALAWWFWRSWPN